MFSAHSSDTPQIGIKHVGSGKIVSIGPSRTTLIATQSHSVQYTHISKIKWGLYITLALILTGIEISSNTSLLSPWKILQLSKWYFCHALSKKMS